jgi:SAM-dependent methyltransferase
VENRAVAETDEGAVERAAGQRAGGVSADKATRAGSFGAVAEIYDRGRPGWPAEAIDWLLGPEPLEVLDLGAGTGKLTAALLAAGHRVTALEPSAGMREVLAARLAGAGGAAASEEAPSRLAGAATASEEAPSADGGAASPAVSGGAEVTILDGRAEEIPLGDGSVDAVVAGSAFHWFDREPTLAEVERVLRPPGVFGLLGNRYDTSIDWQRRLRKISSAGEIYRGGHWPKQEELRERFTEVEDRSIAHHMEVDPAMLRDYLASLSWVATMEPAERERHLAAIDEFWAAEPDLQGRASATLTWRSDVRRSRGVR